MLTKELPYNIEAEQLLLGALLINNRALEHIEEIISEVSFHANVHQEIFKAILRLKEKEIIANAVTLKTFLDSNNKLKEIGGINYLVDIISRATSVLDIVSLARVIQELHLRRQLILIGQKITSRAYDSLEVQDSKLQIENAEQELFQLATYGEYECTSQHIAKSLSSVTEKSSIAFKNREPFHNISTGFKDVDNFMGGLQNSDLIILAGRPSMGKTSLAISMAMRVAKILAKKKLTALFFSLEMSAEQIASRMISIDSKVDAFALRAGKLSDDDLQKIIISNKKLTELPMYIDDTAAISITELRSRARRLHRQHKLGAIFIDYLQLIRGSGKRYDTNRVQEVSEITQGLKLIAKELHIPVVALSQLSRLVEQREDKKPQLSDLRESGSIEQDADVVIFIYREAYYLMRKQPSNTDENYEEWQFHMDEVKNKAEIIIAKQRNGPVGTAYLYFDSKTTIFDDLANYLP